MTGYKRKEAHIKKIREKMGTSDLSGKPIFLYVLLFFFCMPEAKEACHKWMVGLREKMVIYVILQEIKNHYLDKSLNPSNRYPQHIIKITTAFTDSRSLSSL